MITGIKSERIVLADRICSGYIYFENGVITAVSEAEQPCNKLYDFGNDYVSPGFIDIHTHGGGGCDFASGEKEQVIGGCNFHLSHGTTSICPTVSAAPMSDMIRAVEGIEAAKSDPRCRSNIIGAHMEGPYLSAEQCGAQSPDFITMPRAEEYEAAIGAHARSIARVTYAPENDRDGRFCRYLRDMGIVPSAGHTNAIGEDMKMASKMGCRLVTHLYSCTSTITRDHGFRRLGVIESAFLDDDMYVEIIADGKHLPSELIRLILKIKGCNRVAAVTDSLPVAGTDKKIGRTVNIDYIIEDGVCKLKDRSAFAGSIATADVLLRVLVNNVGLPIWDAVRMMTAVPASIMEINKGSLMPGYDADIVAFGDEFEINAVFVGGVAI